MIISAAGIISNITSGGVDMPALVPTGGAT